MREPRDAAELVLVVKAIGLAEHPGLLRMERALLPDAFAGVRPART